MLPVSVIKQRDQKAEHMLFTLCMKYVTSAIVFACEFILLFTTGQCASDVPNISTALVIQSTKL